MGFSNLQREEIVQQLTSEKLDVLVIGGGITGAGIALDATMRGMTTGLVEMQDFAAGTSSRSTKLVHGGLRYLKQFEVKMVAEVGKERAIVYENGPHVTTPEWMLLPFHAGGTFGKYSTSIGLKVYDFLAGVKRSESRQMLSEEETLNKEPLIKKEGLKGGGYYVEYRTDDARLTLEVLKKAVERGARAINYAQVTSLLIEKGTIQGVVMMDQLTGAVHEIHAKKVINATGPWVDDLRTIDHSKTGKTLQLSKGSHIVIDQSVFPLKQAVYFDTPDGRMIFAIPRDGKAYVGTTDTFYQGDPLKAHVTEEDQAYILEAIHYMFPDVSLSAEDVESSWAGIRPLISEAGKNPSEISRKDEIWVSDTGLITIAGGKLTGYRKMAETIVNLVAKQFEQEEAIRFGPCKTKHLPISGGEVGGSGKFETFVKGKLAAGRKIGFSEAEAQALAQHFGSNIDKVYDLVRHYQEDAETFDLPLPVLAKLIYAIQEEMVATPVDYYFRRTSELLFDIGAVQATKEQVIRYMAHHFKWSQAKQAFFAEELEEAIKDATTPQVN